MIIYFIVAIISAIFLYLYLKHKNILFVIISFLLLFFISAFRYGIGIDYLKIYVKMFNFIASGLSVDWDIGTIWLCKLILLFSKDYIYFFIITAFITLFFIYKGILKWSDCPVLVLLLFVFSGEYIASFNAVRQYMAVGIFVYSIKFIIDGNFRKYLIFNVIGGFFHNSAFILIPIYFIRYFNPKKTNQLILIVCTIILLPVLSKLFYTVLGFTKYESYLNSSYNEYDPSYSELIMSVCVYFMSLFFYKQCKGEIKYRVLLSLMLLYMLIAILSFKVILAYRVIIYFRILQIFMIGYLSSKLPKKRDRLIFNAMWILFFSGVTLIGGYYFNWYDTIYKNILVERNII